MKLGIIICSRTSSSRVHCKVFREINGLPTINHLLNRICDLDYKIILAVPTNEVAKYKQIVDLRKIKIHGSEFIDDPLARMNEAAAAFDLDHVIRITHDKIFVNPQTIELAIKQYNEMESDYLYSSKFIDGTGFEIISRTVLSDATNKFKNVEHISYAVRLCAKRVYNFDPEQPRNDVRLLLDYENDYKFMNLIMAILGNNCSLSDVLKYINKNQDFKEINRLPELTIYTCCFNGIEYLEHAIKSVINQTRFHAYEYIFIDDHSTDGSLQTFVKATMGKNNCSFIRNGKNLGLSSSSNVALSNAKGKYILRLDADDFLINDTILHSMMTEIKSTGKDIIYPDNYFGDFYNIQAGNVNHHVGGAIFKTSGLNYVKFTDGLRGLEGYDLFLRAKNLLKIGYYKKPTFFYRQRNGSLSKTNLNERIKLKKKLQSKYDHNEMISDE